MNEFCQNCGNPLEEGATFCSNCGANIEAAAPADENIINKLLKEPKKLIIGLVAILVVVALIVGITSIASNAYTKAIDNYIAVTFEGKSKAIKNLAPKAYWEYLEDEEDETLDDMIEDYEDNWDDTIDVLEDQFGDKIKVTYEIEDKDDLSKKKIEKINEALEDSYDFKENSVKKGYKLDVEMKIKGSEDDDKTDSELTVVKIGGSWYLIRFYEIDDEVRVSFMF